VGLAALDATLHFSDVRGKSCQRIPPSGQYLSQLG
jgi:hypothetical protein